MADDQTESVAFLSSPAAFGGDGPVEVIETHGAFVFLCGDQAIKMKRAVQYDYMDLSTCAKRHDMLVRELELNRPVAPEIYRDVVPVTRGGGSGLAIGGEGETVDWVLRMRRFPAANELVAIAERGELTDALAREIGIALYRYHRDAPVRAMDGAPLIGDILDELGRVFAEFAGAAGAAAVGDWETAARAELSRVGGLLTERGDAGHVRRAHGDLHLRNLVVVDGRPVPFDALEFDETLGTCDLLYDLGFLLMDLCHRGMERAACRVLDAWLAAFAGDEDAGLAALPLFLSVRAAIRAMVLLQTDAARGHSGETAQEIGAYVVQAVRFLSPPPPVLVAVGGFSGSGKSVLARALAPGLGAAPGAVLLSTDEERKAGQPAAEHLEAAQYRPEARGGIYDRLMTRAAAILAAGHSVVLDATFLDPEKRGAAEAVAARSGVRFTGLWLNAAPEVLERRVQDRSGDISDADVGVLRSQLARSAGEIGWTRLEAGGSPGTVLEAARRILRGAAS